MLTDHAPLVMLPGTLCDKRVFGPVADLLGASRTIGMRGASSAPDMAGLVLDKAPERFALCGFSLGAIVALEVIAQAPSRVERLALLGCNARSMPPDKVQARRATVPLAEAEGTASYVAGAWDASVPAWRRDDVKLYAALEAMAADTSLDAFRDQVEIAINRVDSRPRLGIIGVPTLVACGEEDRICPPELSTEIANAIPGATLAIVEGAGHYLTLERPQAVAQLLREWLVAPVPTDSGFFKELS